MSAHDHTNTVHALTPGRVRAPWQAAGMASSSCHTRYLSIAIPRIGMVEASRKFTSIATVRRFCCGSPSTIVNFTGAPGWMASDRTGLP